MGVTIKDIAKKTGLGMPEPCIIRGGGTARFGYEGSASLPGFSAGGAGRNITAVIAGSDAVAAGLLRRAFEQGIKVPDELSVVGYGNSYSCTELHVPLTTVSIHYDRIARKAVNLIKKLNQNGAALADYAKKYGGSVEERGKHSTVNNLRI
jgi:DNA-binding LacI/PurR family transcriptional regulator